MTDLLGPKFLRDWGKVQQCIDLPIGEQLDRLGRGVHHEVDVAAWVEPNIGRHAGEKNVGRRSQRWDCNSLSLEIANGTNLFSSEQLEAADVQAPQKNDRITCFDAKDGRRRELAIDV